MGLVFDAMVVEARQGEQGADVRVEFWRHVVDFVGNFVHRCHRAKEDDFFFPVLVRAKILDERSIRTREHGEEARELTLAIRDGVVSGEWKRVFRVVPEYVVFMRHHMMGEERDLLHPYARSVGRRVQDEIMAGFQGVEKQTIAKRGRQSYIDMARRLCDMTGQVG